MHIACVKNHGIPYLQVMEPYSVIVNGKREDKKRTVLNLGPLSRFDDGKPDYLERLRRSFKDGVPIIPELVALLPDGRSSAFVDVRFDLDNLSDCFCAPKNIGYFILDSLYDGLGIYDVLSLHKSRARIGFDLNGLAKLLVFGRALSPTSKKCTFSQKDDYLFHVTSSENLPEIYRALDVLDEKADAIQKRMNLKITQSLGRDTEVCYYDVTNYWYEIDDNDEDTLDGDGNVVAEGMRKSGPSKVKNRKPITQMGLFIDDKGIPISYRVFPGNHIDQTTLRPAMKKNLNQMKIGRVIAIADGGLNSDKNIAHILSEGNGYILSKSTKKSAKDVRKWILEEDGYEWNEKRTFKVKSKIRERIIKDENGVNVKIKETIISYWSQKHYLREVKENKSFLDYLQSVIDFPDKLKDKEKKIEKFLKKTQVDKETGEVIKTKTLLGLDMEKIREYIDLMGYYTLLSSEVEKSDREIIDKYHGLSRIEDSFRIIKSNLDGRPVYARTPEHINAHFLICFIALTMIRLIQHKILLYQGKGILSADGWESGLTAERIQTALVSFKADSLPGGYFRLTEIKNDLALILNALGVDADLRLPTFSELKQLKHRFDKAGLTRL